MNLTAPIIIVDDDEEDHLIITDGIHTIAPTQELHFRRNGIEALSLLEELAVAEKEISLLVFDLNMPKMGGVELLKRVKADGRFNTVPIIIYSTSVNTIERDACIKLGAYAYITKPNSFKESLEIAREFLQIASGS